VELDVLGEAIDHLCESDPSAYADTESIELIFGQLARLDAFATRATASFDTAGNWVPSGARNAVAWLTARCRLPKSSARRIVRRGREIRHLPVVDEAWAKGDIAAAQVDVMAGLRSDATEEALARDEETLVDQARALPYQTFVKVAAYWAQLADPDGAEQDEQLRRAARDVYLDRSFGGMWFGKLTLDPISGAIVGGELERLEQVLFAADWAEAKAALGREPTLSALARTPGQRRADALVEMATRSKMVPDGARRPGPLLSILIDYQTTQRVCELADGTVVAPGSLRPWMDEALFERVVFAPTRRVECSKRARLFTGATRRGIELRDRQCAHPYCDVEASKCDADHIVPSADGGLTIQENGRMLCGFHNRQRNGRPGRPPPDD
jgi:hypothetical protein